MLGNTKTLCLSETMAQENVGMREVLGSMITMKGVYGCAEIIWLYIIAGCTKSLWYPGLSPACSLSHFMT